MAVDGAKSKLSEYVQNIRTTFLARTDEQLAGLIKRLRQLDDEELVTLRDDLHLTLHRIAGSAGTFGLPELSALARQLDQRLRQEEGATDWLMWESDLVALHARLNPYRQSGPGDVKAGCEIDQNEPMVEGFADLHLLIATDDPDYGQLLASVLRNSFQVTVAHTGAQTIATYQQHDADLVLLDLGLPDMNGYDVCRQLDEIRLREWRSVIFVSASDTLDDKLAAYQAGGDDFVAKPIQLNEFLAKIKAVAAYTQAKKNLQAQSQFAQRVAFDSMAESSSYGRLVEFTRAAMMCRTLDGLAEAFFSLADTMGIKVALRYSDPDVIGFGAPGQLCSPIEQKLFVVLQDAGRLHHFGQRTMVNGRYVGFLVKNMPVDDELLYGRLKDLVAVIVEVMDSCFITIARDAALSKSLADLSRIIQRMAEEIPTEESTGMQSLRHLDLVFKDLEVSFHFLDLNEDQERYFQGLLGQAAQDAENILELVVRLRQDLLDVSRNLARY